jgi:FtsP/CotA-like multicopper oxidase with cupredoxin domain
MWVYAMDGSYIEPQKVQGLVITNGDRYSVLVKIQRAGDFKIRVASNTAAQMLIGHAVLSVPAVASSDEAPVTESQPWLDIVGLPLSEEVAFFVQDTAAPFPPDVPAQTADALHVLTMRVNGASYLWALNSTSLMPKVLDQETPLLFAPDADTQDNVTITTQYGQWIDLVFLAEAAPMPPHPIHKHGNKMYQIGAGEGPFTWSSVEEAMAEIPENFNLVNPPRRDAFATAFAVTGPTWIVVRYHVDNAGAWLLHCHVNNHMLGGMMMVIQDGIDQWPFVPSLYRNY